MRATDVGTLSYDVVRRLISYDAITGGMVWKARTADMFKRGRWSQEHSCACWNSQNAGKTAGTSNGSPYNRIVISGRTYLSHRIAWLYMTGDWPKGQIDHANMDKRDNRWDNLREATCAQNSCNVGARSTNTTGLKGVTKTRSGFCSYIGIDNKNIYLGTFKTPEEAFNAYVLAGKKLHGDFFRIDAK